MRGHVRIVAGSCALLWTLLGVIPAAAQGNGRGNAHGHNKRPSGGSSSSGSSSPTSSNSAGGSVEAPEGNIEAAVVSPEGTGVRAFGSWLDDASMMNPGSGYASFAVSYWRMPGFTEVDVPTFDAGIGLTPRVQVGASVPVYHAGEPGGPVARGLGDLQLTSKIQLRDPSAGGGQIGFALSPMVEVRSSAPAPGSSRYGWAVPVSMELQRTGWRVYGSTGYFSRGALFASGALEYALTERTWLTGTLSQSHSIKRDDLSEALGLAKVRTDVGGGVTMLVTETIAVFGSVGRTLSTQDANRTDLSLVGGLSMSFVAWTR